MKQGIKLQAYENIFGTEDGNMVDIVDLPIRSP